MRTTAGPIGTVLAHVHSALDPWLGQPTFQNSPIAPKLKYAVAAEDNTRIRLKIEINTTERDAHDGTHLRPFKVVNPWFTGEADIPTFSDEELLATKLRALLQRKKGRDLIDLSHALKTFRALDVGKLVDLFGRYLTSSGTVIPRAVAEERMFAKFDDPNFMRDVGPLLAADERATFDAAAARAAFIAVFDRIICLIPGKAWARTSAKRQELALKAAL